MKTPGSSGVTLLHRAVPFLLSLVLAVLVGAVVGLFVYQDARDPTAKDIDFLITLVAFVAVGVIVGSVLARRVRGDTMEDESIAGAALLKKYRTKAPPPPSLSGSTARPEQKIAEEYLEKITKPEA